MMTSASVRKLESTPLLLFRTASVYLMWPCTGRAPSVRLTAGAVDMPNAWKADLFVTHDKDYNNAVGLALALKQNEVWLLLTRQSQPRARLLAQKPRP